MTDGKRKAYSYSRMSTSQQLEGDSLRRQTQDSEVYANSHGLELVEKLEDIGLSAYTGKNVEAGALGDFLKAIKRGDIPNDSVLLIESLDRLSRQEPISAFSLFTEILKAGVSIVTLEDETEYTEPSLNKDFSKFLMSVAAMYRANEESELKSRRLKAAWENKRNQAETKKLTAIGPAWLEANDKRTEFIQIPERVKIVKEIFRRSIDGFGAGAIAAYLNGHISDHPPFSQPVPSNKARTSRGNRRWHKSYVQKILNNRAVIGEFQPHIMDNGKRVPKGEPIPHYFPQIVSENDLILSQARTAKRRISGAGRKGPSFSNLFTRIAVCGTCGGSIGFLNKGMPPKGARYLRCTNSASGADCNAPGWRYEEFEDSFVRWIKEVSFEEVVNPDDLATQRNELRNQQTVLTQRISDENDRYAKLRERLSDVPQNTYADFLGDVGKKKAEIEGLEKEKDQVERELAVLSEHDSSKAKQDLIERINDLQKSLSDEKKKELRTQLHNQIQSVVESITVHNNDHFLPGDNVGDLVPDVLIQNLAKMGRKFTNPKELEEFLLSGGGKRIFHRYQRHYTVKFKNGSAKTVYPDRDLAVMTISERMAEFTKKVLSKK